MIDINKEIWLLKNVTDSLKLVENNLSHECDVDQHHLRQARQCIDRFMLELHEFIQEENKE